MTRMRMQQNIVDSYKSFEFLFLFSLKIWLTNPRVSTDKGNPCSTIMLENKTLKHLSDITNKYEPSKHILSFPVASENV